MAYKHEQVVCCPALARTSQERSAALALLAPMIPLACAVRMLMHGFPYQCAPGAGAAAGADGARVQEPVGQVRPPFVMWDLLAAPLAGP